MREIEVKDLNMGLLKKRTKVELMRMLCHVANMANEYTPAGVGAIGDRALCKLNLTRPKFEVRFKEDRAAGDDTERVRMEKPFPLEHPPYESVLIPWEPKPGDKVKIVDGSTYWSPGKVGTVKGKMEGGWEVSVHFADGFNGETKPITHTICAYKIEPHTEEKKDAKQPTNPS